MKPASTALQNYLNGLGPSSPALFADLITFALYGGQFLRFSMAQFPLSPPANSFQPPDASGNGASINYAASSAPLSFPLGPLFSRLKTSVKIGLDPDRAQLSIFPHPPGDASPDLVGTLSWQDAALLGFFNGAAVEVDRLFMPAVGDYSLGSFVLHLGRVGQIKIGRSKIDMEIPNLLVLLTGQYPRRLFQPQCTWAFGDSHCTYNRSLNAESVASNKAQSALSIGVRSLLATPSTLYNFGTISAASGANNGFSRTISSASPGSPGTIVVTVPFPYPIDAGDLFTLLPGCDHTIATCDTVFDNEANFGGFPYIPPPEAAV